MSLVKNLKSIRARLFHHTSVAVGACSLAALLSVNALAGERLNFDPDWKFIKADPTNALSPGLNDHNWTTVSAPHTYNDTDTFDDWSTPGHRGEQIQWGGRTWYRKTFTVPKSFKGKQVYIEFEGVRQIAEVYLNGQLLGVSKTGFIPFGFDLTPNLRFGAENVLAVMCDNRFMKDPLANEAAADPANPAPKGKKKSAADSVPAPAANPNLGELSAKVNATIPEEIDEIQANQIPWNNPHWHPAHGGIYRNVYLHVVDPLHMTLPLYSFLQTEGPYVYATDISDKSAKVNLEVPLQNDRKSSENVELKAEVIDRDGKPVLTLNQSSQIAAGARAQLNLSGDLAQPQLWEPGYPYLYRVVCSVSVNGKSVDTQEIPLGIRSVRWDAQTGFYINGQHVKLHGWGQKPTDEWPGLGAAQPDWLHFFTLDLMKEAGGNFVRWGHCAAGPALIAAGDRLGIIAEQPGLDGESDTRGAAWKIRAAGFRDMIIYYRNNPSLLIYEGGNQKVTREHARELRGYMDKYDPHGGRVYAHRRADQTTSEFMDIGIGTEGGREIGRLPVVEGEYDREESPRRVWDDFSPPNYGYPEAKGQTYQLTSEQYAVNEVGQFVRKLGAANHSGGANWLFSDSTSGGRVACEVARAGGEVDGARLPKEAYYVCQTMFRTDPQVHIIGHWNYAAGTNKTIYVASNGESVELFVNGKSLGRGTVSDRYLFTFPNVAWQPGEIKAVAYTGGKPVATNTKHTVGAPVTLHLTRITGPGGLHANGSDVALIDVEALDANGERCPTFQQRVDFQIDGPAIWRGGYNSGKIKSINNLFLDLECGINRVSVRSTLNPGAVTVRAKCAGLKPAVIKIKSSPVKLESGFSTELPTLPVVALARQRIVENAANEANPTAPKGPPTAGKFTKAFSYSGPTGIVHVEQNAQDGKNIYVDRDFPFASLPAEFTGADWVQGANNDSLYNAVDLMEVAVNANTIISVAHDDRLARPDWLTRQFKPTNLSFVINGKPMKVFQHRADHEESLTLGANTENISMKSCNMYLVIVNAAPAAH
ncbi:MAG: lacZ 4 [Pedosphaera sp.]|nr:lacZ 4 [Pedosphaera sp.]